MEGQELKSAVEALLFASERPLTLEEISSAFEGSVSAGDLREQLTVLKAEYENQGRGFRLTEIAGGFQISTDPRFSYVLKNFYQSREKKKLSQASLETLSVIAYRQPVTKADIEFIRGVNVDGPLKTVCEKGLVRIVGRKDVPGRPILYGTTKLFLEHFNLNSLKELSELSKFTEEDLDQNLLPPELKNGRSGAPPPVSSTDGGPIPSESPETGGAGGDA